MAIQRIRVVFRGRVQGVGFRAATCRAAGEAGAVTGWVRNEPDGSVTCMAEGESQVLDLFTKSILSRMSRYIESHLVVREPATGEFSSFTVNY